MTRYKVTISNGYAGCRETYVEETDLTKEEFIQELWEAEAQKINITAEKIEPEPEIDYTSETVISDAVQEFADNLVSDRSVGRNEPYPENWDKFSELAKIRIESEAYAELCDCAICGWTYYLSDLSENPENRELICENCEADLEEDD